MRTRAGTAGAAMLAKIIAKRVCQLTCFLKEYTTYIDAAFDNALIPELRSVIPA